MQHDLNLSFVKYLWKLCFKKVDKSSLTRLSLEFNVN